MADPPLEQIEIQGAREQDLDEVHRCDTEGEGQPGCLTLVETNGPRSRLSKRENVEFAGVQAAVPSCEIVRQFRLIGAERDHHQSSVNPRAFDGCDLGVSEREFGSSRLGVDRRRHDGCVTGSRNGIKGIQFRQVDERAGV